MAVLMQVMATIFAFGTLMIAAVAAMLGIAANAASVEWTSSYNFCAEDGTVYTAATAPAGSIVLVYLGSGTADWESAVVVNEVAVEGKSSRIITTEPLFVHISQIVALNHPERNLFHCYVLAGESRKLHLVLF